VHLWEDEFSEVRLAGIESLCNVGFMYPELCPNVVDSLVDMLNDDTDEVRRAAILAMARLGRRVQLSEEVLSGIVLAALDDAVPITRQALHEMLGHLQVANCDELRAVLTCLSRALTKYPEDRESVMLCFQRLGKHHASFVGVLAPELLRFSPGLMQRPAMPLHHPTLCGMAAVVYNAAVKDPGILALLPTSILNNFRFYVAEYPSLFPVARFQTDRPRPRSFPLLSVVPVVCEAFSVPAYLGQQMALADGLRLRLLGRGGSFTAEIRQSTQTEVAKLQQEVGALAELGNRRSVLIEFYSLLLHWMASTFRVVLADQGVPREALRRFAEEARDAVVRMLATFLGLNTVVRAHLLRLYVTSNILLLLAGERPPAATQCRALLTFLQLLGDYHQRHGIPDGPDPVGHLAALIRSLPAFFTGQQETSSLLASLWLLPSPSPPPDASRSPTNLDRNPKIMSITYGTFESDMYHPSIFFSHRK
jgi:hypothetical protein